MTATPEKVTSAKVLSERDLLVATAAYAKESKAMSWWVVGSTFVLMFGSLAAAALLPWWPVQLAFSILSGLILVRGFIMLHDYAHGAILRKSKLAHSIFIPFSMFFMTGFHYWRDTHNFHHNHVLDMREPSHGTFPVMNLDEWEKAGFLEALQLSHQPQPADAAVCVLHRVHA